MGKAFALALMVIAIWIGVSIYTEGAEHALGGALVELGLVEPTGDAAPPAVTERVRERVGEVYREHEERTRRALERD